VFRKVLLYGLPIYLYGLELLLKALASIQADSIAGPTLAGAGLGFLLPLTELKDVPVDPTTKKALDAKKASAYSKNDKTFCDFIWTCFFVSLGAWMYCMYLTLKLPRETGSVLNRSLAIGCIVFLGSVALTELKERLKWNRSAS